MQNINTYITLGGSGLRVSRLSLGTMTFGVDASWGSTESEARDIFNKYCELGGNFIDTANIYSGGVSEEIVGKIIKENKNRDKIVLATKFSSAMDVNDPNSGGNSRKNLIASLDASLKRLQTDYIDLYWVHHWDSLTPAEEIIYSLNNAVQSGKVRYIGLSNVPAWLCARMQTIAEQKQLEKICALQLPYNPLNRIIECEYTRMAQDLNMGICVWGALASGLLSGKNSKNNVVGRLANINKDMALAHGLKKDNPWIVVDEINNIAKEINASPSAVAIAWALNKQAVSSVIIGARTMEQLLDNLNAESVQLNSELIKRIDTVSAAILEEPYQTFVSNTSKYKRMLNFNIIKEPKNFRA